MVARTLSSTPGRLADCRRWQAPDFWIEGRDEGVPRGPGGPPSNYAESPALLRGVAKGRGLIDKQALYLGDESFGLREDGGFQLGMVADPGIERANAADGGVQTVE